MSSSVDGLLVEQALDDAALEQVLVDDLRRRPPRLTPAVEGALGIDDHDGAQRRTGRSSRCWTTLTSLSRPLALASRARRLRMICRLPEEVQPVPPQTRTCERNSSFVSSSLISRRRRWCIPTTGLPLTRCSATMRGDLLGRHLHIGDLLLAGHDDLHDGLITGRCRCSRSG